MNKLNLEKQYGFWKQRTNLHRSHQINKINQLKSKISCEGCGSEIKINAPCGSNPCDACSGD